MNTFLFRIYNEETKEWENLSPYAVFPFKCADLLDEQLDEAEIWLKSVKKEYFRPLTLAKVNIYVNPSAVYGKETPYNTPEREGITQREVSKDNGVTRQESMEILFVVANDNAVEYPIGSGRYNHELYLIELTKIMEGYIGDSISFTNPLGSNYTDKNFVSFPVRETDNIRDTLSIVTSNYYKVTNNGVGEFETQSVAEFYQNLDKSGITSEINMNRSNAQIVKITGLTSGTVYYTETAELGIDTTSGKNVIIDFYTINGVTKQDNISDGDLQHWTIPYRTITIDKLESVEIYYQYPTNTTTVSATITVSFSQTKYPPKKWSITDVINRCLDTVISIKYGEKPKFRLQGVTYDDTSGNIGWYNEGEGQRYEPGSIAEEYDKIIAPEMNFAKMTLREMLQQVGGFVHAEPRITGVHFEQNGERWYEVGFDKYGGVKKSRIKARPYVSAAFKTDINEYATGLDSSANNLVSQMDWAQGVVVEPFTGGKISLRSDTTTIRMADTINNNDVFIPTNKPIYQIKEVNYIEGDGTKYDITSYIYEAADYNNLSSYEGTYPYVKSYGLFYTQGERNIKGLFFKNDDAIDPIFQKYAILNILSSVTGKDISIRGASLMELTFEVKYLPVATARVQTNKAVVIKGIPRTLAYNQSANLIETRFYGENLKGVIARLGNVERTYTYNLAYLSDIPKCGTLWDANYYISAVNYEILPTYIRCTVGLSKDFNRLSQYVGISSDKRMWEVSEKQAFDRDSVISEYLVAQEVTGTNYPLSDSDCIFASSGFLGNFFPPSAGNNKRTQVSAMEFRTFDKSGNPLNNGVPRNLPVTSTAMGNSIMFTANFADNYSVGNKAVYVSGKENGYWSAYVPYGDYYGRFYWFAFRLLAGTDVKFNTASATTLPEGSLEPSGIERDTPVQTKDYTGAEAYKYAFRHRHDSREVPSITYELKAVAASEDIIIGSALMSNSSLVNANPFVYSDFAFYGFTEPINPLTREVSGGTFIREWNDDFITDSNNNRIGFLTPYLNPEVPENNTYVAWALVTKSTEEIITVEDEDGNVTEQKIKRGGELIIGQNKPPVIRSRIIFTIKKDVYA